LEYIAKTTFREINLGENSGNGETLSVGGHQFTTKGFRVCGSCGKVLIHRNDPKDHAISCQYRRNVDRAKALEVLYLYREFESESIRFLMPNEGFWSDKGLHSFIAALQLGLKEKFKGKVDHLNVAISEEPQADSSIRKSFLYLYDSVPGGTGYLKQLIRDPEKLKDVFLKAQKIVTACGCEDGCYECLFAYRNSFEQDQTSRNTAKKLLKSLLNHWNTLAVIDHSLSSIKIDTNLDGELEKMLIEAIRVCQFPSLTNALGSEKVFILPELRKEIFNGKTGYLLTIGQQK
jgi:DEAD/DEAH box helicase domain-containing protein